MKADMHGETKGADAGGYGASLHRRIAAAAARVQAAESEVENYKMILLRQKSIKGFYQPPKEGYKAREREVRQIEAQLAMLLDE